MSQPSHNKGSTRVSEKSSLSNWELRNYIGGVMPELRWRGTSESQNYSHENFGDTFWIRLFCQVKTYSCFRYFHTCFRYGGETGGERNFGYFWRQTLQEPQWHGLVKSSPLTWLLIRVSLKVTKLCSSPVLPLYSKQGLVLTLNVKVSIKKIYTVFFSECIFYLRTWSLENDNIIVLSEGTWPKYSVRSHKIVEDASVHTSAYVRLTE